MAKSTCSPLQPRPITIWKLWLIGPTKCSGTMKIKINSSLSTAMLLTPILFPATIFSVMLCRQSTKSYHQTTSRTNKAIQLWPESRRMLLVYRMATYSILQVELSTMCLWLRMLSWATTNTKMIALKDTLGTFSWIFPWNDLETVWLLLNFWKIIISFNRLVKKLWRIWIFRMLSKHSKWAKILQWFLRFSH